jgi:hypothetical protein
MDQTPLIFSYHSLRMLEQHRKRTVNVCKTSSQMRRATAALTIMAARNFLTPMIMFKGKPDGLIMRRKLPTLNPTSMYACQDAMWMNEHCMLVWVDEIFGPYLVANPLQEGVQPVLLLDLYRCHMMALVVSRIEARGMHIIHIPGGCMSLTQPLGIGINQLFKARCCWMWEDWLTNLLNMTNMERNATCNEVSDYAVAVYWELVVLQMLWNLWRRMGFDWFLGVVNPDDITDGGKGNNGHDNGKHDNDTYGASTPISEFTSRGHFVTYIQYSATK